MEMNLASLEGKKAMGAINFLKRVIGIAEYRRGSDIINFLSDTDSSQDFSKPGYLLLANDHDYKLWLIVSKSHTFIVLDDGFELRALLKRAKEDFHFKIIKEEDSARMSINKTVTTLPIDAALTGSLADTRRSIESFLALS